IGLLLPALQKVRESANLTQCENNLKQIGLAAANYHDTNNGFPISVLQLTHGRFSVFVLLLPYLEQQALYEAIYQQAQSGSFTYGLGSPNATPLSVLACPSDSGILPLPIAQGPPQGQYHSVTSYRPSGGLGSIITDNQSLQMLAITDGTS